MAILSTGPIENNPVSGSSPTTVVTMRIVNPDSVNASMIEIAGYVLDGTRTLYANQIITLMPGEVVSVDYYANFPAYEFVFTLEDDSEIEVSVWGKSSTGQLVDSQRLVTSELL